MYQVRCCTGRVLHLVNFRLKEKTMFTFDAVVENSVKAAKQFNAYVQDTAVRKNLDSLVDASATYAKDVYTTSSNLVKTMQENVQKIDMTKYFAK